MLYAKGWLVTVLVAAVMAAFAASTASASVIPPPSFGNQSPASSREVHCGIAVLVSVVGPFGGWTIVRAAAACVGAAVATGR